jgi:translation initiation factor 3 subunit M
LARGLVDESRITFIKPFSEGLVKDERQRPFDESPERRKKIISMVLAEVKGLGQGSERGT